MSIKIYKYIIATILIIFLVLLIFTNSINTLIPSRDSGTFLYAGKEILQGKIPYKDFWEHKTPLIFLINAFALKLFNGDFWGLWIIELIFLFLSLLLFFILTNKIFIFNNSIIGLIFISYYLIKFLEGGNRVEEFAILFQIVILVLFYNSHNTSKIKSIKIYSFITGVFTAFLFLLRPNLIGIFLSILITNSFLLLKDNYKKYINNIIFVILGISLPIISIIVFFSYKSAIIDFFDQTIIFNIIYSDSNIEKKIISILNFIRTNYNVFILTFIGYILLLKEKKKNIIVTLSSIWLPIEIIFSSISGREYKHYYLSLLIPLIILLIYPLNKLFSKLDKITNKNIFKISILNVFIIISLYFIFFNKEIIKIFINFDEKKPFDRNFNFRSFLYNNFDEHKDTISIIKKETTNYDKIIIWGSEPSLYLISNRVSASKYFYQFRLFHPNYDVDGHHINRFIYEVKYNLPKLIIDASESTYDKDIGEYSALPPLDKEKMLKWKEKSNYKNYYILDELVNFIEENYLFISKTYHNKWLVYKLNNL